MLQRISWSAYWAVIVTVLAIYYLVLLFLLYRKGFFFKNSVKTISSSRSPEPSTGQQSLFQSEAGPYGTTPVQNLQPSFEDDSIVMPLVHDLIQALREFITEIAERSYVKEEIITGIQFIIKGYSKLKGSPYQKSINDFIKNECEDYCSVHLSEEDVKRVWNG
jgi:hypothetical protein